MMRQTSRGRVRLSRDDSRNVTRNRLIDSATELFARVGVSDTSLRTVAENAGYSRGAVHSNFADKAELAEAVALNAIAKIGPSINAALTSSAASGERLEDYIRKYLHFCTDQPLQTGALIAVVRYQSRFDAERFDARVEGSLSDIIELFEDGQRRDEMRTFDPWLMASMLRATVDAVAAHLIAGALPTSADDAANELVTTFERATRKESPGWNVPIG